MVTETLLSVYPGNPAESGVNQAASNSFLPEIQLLVTQSHEMKLPSFLKPLNPSSAGQYNIEFPSVSLTDEK